MGVRPFVLEETRFTGEVVAVASLTLGRPRGILTGVKLVKVLFVPPRGERCVDFWCAAAALSGEMSACGPGNL